MESLDTEERRKIADMVKMKKDGGDGGSMDWMYSSKKDNAEDYLLGKKIDKHFEKGNETPPKEDDIFGERIRANIALDMQAKMREDPLYSIKKREEESRKKILHNPVRMKELQHMIAQQKKEKKKKSKKKHKRERGGGDEDDLVQKYLSILSHKHGQKGHTSSREPSTSSDSQSDDQSYSSRRKHQEKKGRSRQHLQRDSRKHGANRHYGLNKSQRQEDETKVKVDSRTCSRSPAESPGQSRSYKKGQRESHRKSWRPHPADKSSSRHRSRSPPPSKVKVSAEERERRLQEMRENAAWREEQRRSNVQRYAVEDKCAERQEEERRGKKGAHADSAEFLNPLMSEHAKNSTVEDRLKRNKYNIQRTNAALEKDFTKH